jgi:hypothetical protein
VKNKDNIFGIIFLVLGALLSAGTAWIFPVCGPKDDGSWMKCHWSSQALIGIGVVLVVLAVAYLIVPQRHAKAGMSLAIIPVGLFAIAVPNGLIGLCGMAEMQCRATTQPAVTIISAAIVLLAAFNAIRLFRMEPKRETDKK